MSALGTEGLERTFHGNGGVSAIQTEGLGRTFQGKGGVSDLTFTVGEGEIFGFLGPNGAGKTTTIRLLTGQLRPTSGRAWVAGCEVGAGQDGLRQRIGVVAESQNLYERMSGRANLEFSAGLYGVGRQRVNELLEQVGLLDRAGDRVQKYSNGMKQRILIARALLHRPQVLFLDEPTRGLDPAVAREIRKMVADLAGQGVTVFLTTHYMEEADQLCGRVAFLNEGRIVALDAPGQLKLIQGQRQVVAILAGGEQVTLPLDHPQGGQRLGELAASGRVLTMHSTEATLEEVFLALTGRRLQ